MFAKPLAACRPPTQAARGMEAPATALPKIRGLSSAYQHELIGLCADLAATPDVDDEIARRARWLQWALEGRQPGQEPLPQDLLPYAGDAGPLAPVLAGDGAFAQERQ